MPLIALFSFSVVQATRKGFVMLTCQLTDISQDIEYEWVPAKYNLNGPLSVGQIQKGQTFVMEEKWDEVTCRYYGNQGLLGNVTFHNQVMSKFSSTLVCTIHLLPADM